MMLTRCPACQTTFRLGPEQLRARQGEVRCGHCFHPFNALEHEIVPPSSTPHIPRVAQGASLAPSPASPLAGPGEAAPREAEAQETARREGILQEADFIVLEEKPAASSPAAEDPGVDIPDEFPPPAPRPPPFDPDTVEAETPAEETSPLPVLPEVLRSGRRPAAESARSGTGTASDAWSGPENSSASLHSAGTSDAEAPEAGLSSGTDSSPPATDADAADDEQAGILPASLDEPKASPRVAYESAPQAAREAAHIDIEQLDAKYGRPKAPASPRQRALASLAVGLLGGLLAAQCAYLYRMEIARDLPGLRPLLKTACAALGCTVPFPRDVQLISIDNSDLQSEPGKPGQYILYATISNRAEYAQTWPHLELTLTDARDTPVARRVLAPHEWIPPAQHGDTFASRSAVNARIAFAAPDLAPTGYRVGKFYP